LPTTDITARAGSVTWHRLMIYFIDNFSRLPVLVSSASLLDGSGSFPVNSAILLALILARRRFLLPSEQYFPS
jgi:hypothetical protein